MPVPGSSAVVNALTIAGSDSGGGAGIQADLKTFAALGVYGCSAITAITAQNTCGVQASQTLSPLLVRQQIEAVFSDITVSAVKTGMLGSAEVVSLVAEQLSKRPDIPLVVDPVMVATSGDCLLDEGALKTFIRQLLPLATLITPNLHEAAQLLRSDMPASVSDMRQAARALHRLGAGAVLLKGGHLSGDECTDILFDGENFFEFHQPKIRTSHTHGTGCTLASAVAAGLAKGEPLVEAVAGAKAFITSAIAASDKLSVGRGHGPVNHFHALWQ